MGFFSKAKDMYSLQKQAKSLKKELKNIHIEAEADGITVVMNAEQEVISIRIDDMVWNEVKGLEYGKKKLEDAFLKSLQKGLKKAQEIAASKMKGIWDQMGVPQQ